MDSKSIEGNFVRVQVPPSAPRKNTGRCFFCCGAGLALPCKGSHSDATRTYAAGGRLRSPSPESTVVDCTSHTSAPRKNTGWCFFCCGAGLALPCKGIHLDATRTCAAGGRLRSPSPESTVVMSLIFHLENF